MEIGNRIYVNKYIGNIIKNLLRQLQKNNKSIC